MPRDRAAMAPKVMIAESSVAPPGKKPGTPHRFTARAAGSAASPAAARGSHCSPSAFKAKAAEPDRSEAGIQALAWRPSAPTSVPTAKR